MSNGTEHFFSVPFYKKSLTHILKNVKIAEQKGGRNMNSLEQFLRNIQPYTCGDASEFIAELKRVPNYEEEFENLLKDNREWLEKAKSASDEKGYHVYFLLDYIKLGGYETLKRENKLSLRLFEQNKVPTIKVTIFR